ncbi:unnamed protein product, partial [marine sediment metagenome]
CDLRDIGLTMAGKTIFVGMGVFFGYKSRKTI